MMGKLPGRGTISENIIAAHKELIRPLWRKYGVGADMKKFSFMNYLVIS